MGGEMEKRLKIQLLLVGTMSIFASNSYAENYPVSGLYNVIYMNEPDSVIEAHLGDGNNKRFIDAITMIAPSGWSSFLMPELPRSFNKNALVHWSGNRQWTQVLNDVASDLRVGLSVDWIQKQIFIGLPRPQPVSLTWSFSKSAAISAEVSKVKAIAVEASKPVAVSASKSITAVVDVSEPMAVAVEASKLAVKTLEASRPVAIAVEASQPAVEISKLATAVITSKPSSIAIKASAPVAVVAPVWTISPTDNTIRRALAKWATKAGWQLQWDAPEDVLITVNASFTGDFRTAVNGLFSSLSASDVNLNALLYSGNHVVRVVEVGQRAQ